MSEETKIFSTLIQKLKSEWQTSANSELQFSDSVKQSLFLKLREIEAKNSFSISWELLANYSPRLSIASAAVAICLIVTFQFSVRDLSHISFNERIESESSELIAGSEQDDDFDPSDLIVDEQQGEEV